MADNVILSGTLGVLREILEGGEPGKGTSVIDGTKADGSGNSGLLATLDRLDATQASRPTALGLSAAAHAAHAAYYFEVALRWAKGDRSKSDWPGSFEPRAVDDAQWRATRIRLRTGYEAFVAFARSHGEWSEDDAGSLAGALAHSAYHLGAVRQVVKLATSA